MKKRETDEELIEKLSQYNERSPDRHRAQHELTTRALHSAGKATYVWTVIGAIAAVAAAIFALISLFKD